MAGTSCSRCGRWVDVVDGRHFGVLVQGTVTVERVLCRACLDDVLGAVTAAVRPFDAVKRARLYYGRA